MADAGVRVRRGLYGFASTTFILSMYNVQARGVTTPNVVIGMALFVGGLAQFVAGMWAFAVRNTFSATGTCLSPAFAFAIAAVRPGGDNANGSPVM